MKVEDLYVGQHVKFRSWEDMKSEFGTDEDGDIRTSLACFISDMRYLCETDFVVEEYDSDDGEIEEPSFEDPSYPGAYWVIFADMIEPCCDVAVDTAVDTGDLL